MNDAERSVCVNPNDVGHGVPVGVTEGEGVLEKDYSCVPEGDGVDVCVGVCVAMKPEANEL